MRRINSMVWGTVLLLLGLVLVLNQLNIIYLSADITWPVILLGISVVFHLYYFLSKGRNEGLLVPGGILLTYGLMFLAVFQFHSSFNLLWPLFILGPAVGLFELYVFSRGRDGSLIPVVILTVIGGGFLLRNLYSLNFVVIVAVLLIFVGAALMISAILKSGFRSAKQREPVINVNADGGNASSGTQEQPKQ